MRDWANVEDVFKECINILGEQPASKLNLKLIWLAIKVIILPN